VNVIDSYLDTLFAPYPDTPRLREAKTELRAMMEDKQQGLLDEGLTESQAVGQVIAEFGTLEEVAPVLGIDAELGRASAPGRAVPEAPAAPELDIFRAREYVETVHRTQWLPAAGLALFVLCAAPLLLLIAVTAAPTGEPAGWAIAAGITAVLVMVSLGVILMMVRDAHLKDFEDIDQGEFVPTAQVRGFAKQLQREHHRTATVAQGAAIMLWILCALPTILLALLGGEDSLAVLYGVCLTLVMVALGLVLVTRAGWSDSASSTLLQEEECEDDDPEYSTHPAVRAVAAVYWPVMAAIYLAWSFLGDAWSTSWVLWPVAGALYAGLSSLGVALRREENDPRTRPAARRA